MNINLIVNNVQFGHYGSVSDAYKAALQTNVDGICVKLTQRAIAKPWPKNLKQILIKVKQSI